MTLSSGTKLGPYEIRSPLGTGGMGEVYRAADSKLGRDVALKVILQEFTQDTQLMARFQREAQVLASLNHTNIASIYGLEDSGDVRALVMELVEGPTLADRIKEGAIPTASELLKPRDARLMRCYPVSTRINSVANDDVGCSAPVELARIQSALFS
jgi:eukaryotic-like serine/threonine-protein kinase